MATVSTVNAGDEILAGDVNAHINQTNTNTGNISSNTNSINTANGNIATNTSDINSINNKLGNLPARFSHFSGGGSGTFNHNLGATPSCIAVTYAGNFGTAPTQPIAYYNVGGSTVSISAQGGYSWVGIAFA